MRDFVRRLAKGMALALVAGALLVPVVASAQKRDFTGKVDKITDTSFATPAGGAGEYHGVLVGSAGGPPACRASPAAAGPPDLESPAGPRPSNGKRD